MLNPLRQQFLLANKNVASMSNNFFLLGGGGTHL